MAKINDDVLVVLKECAVNGYKVSLPARQLDRKLYTEVAKQLQLIGGKWTGGKVQAFVFKHEPAALLESLLTGEGRNLKKEFQFFGTPPVLADRLVSLAEIEDGMIVLEPSAGQGAIVEAIYRAFPRNMFGPNDQPCVTVDYYELMEQNNEILSRKLNSLKEFLGSPGCQGRTSCMGFDFLTAELETCYPRIIANPPFSKNQDIDHIYAMYQRLRTGGRLVTLASQHWLFSNNKKETDFRFWLDTLNAEIIKLDGGEFKESGTMTSACILVIDE